MGRILLLMMITTTLTVLEGQIISFSNPHFSSQPDEALISGRPFTGIAIDLYANHLPYHLALFWKGQQTGSEWTWYPDGGLWSHRQYKSGLAHGEWQSWYPEGGVKSLSHYRDGLAHGEFWTWFENGQLASFDVFADNHEVAHKAWQREGGKPVSNYVYQDGKKVGLRRGEFCKTENGS